MTKRIQFGAMDDTSYLSQVKYDELVRELETLKTVKRREVAERLDFAKSLGDLSENAEYHSARDDQAELEDRIAEIELALKQSKIISSQHGGAVRVGSQVVVKKAGGTSETYTIVGAEEVSLATAKISHQSPLGAALLGKKKGDWVNVKTPRGESEYSVVDIL